MQSEVTIKQYLKYFVFRQIKTILKKIQLFFIKRPSLNSDHREIKIIVSLTSHSTRVRNVDLTIKTLFKQTTCADKIILNLSKNEFNDNNIPKSLLKLQKNGLEINYVSDTRSYKKLIPTLTNHPNDIIITVDDDILYPSYLIQRLIDAYEKNPNMSHGCRGYMMQLSKDNTFEKYGTWPKCKYPTYGNNIMLTGIGSVLYGPGCFHKDVSREDLFMQLAPTADDLWFKAMCLLNNTPSNVVIRQKQFKADFMPTNNSMINPLKAVNVKKGGNNKAIASILNSYPELLNHLEKITQHDL